MALTVQPWYLRTPTHWRHMRIVPFARLWLLLSAAFLLFSIFGFYDDIVAGGALPYLIVLITAAYTGLNAMLWVLMIYRLPLVFIAVLVVLQFFNGTIVRMLSNSITRTFSPAAVSPHDGIHFAATATVVVAVASYLFFIGYIRAEGKESYRFRTELELAHGIQKTLVPAVSLHIPQFEIFGVSVPSEKVGGDLVDAVMLPNGDVIAYVADIAGHGLSAGILMGMLKTAARTALHDAGTVPPADSLPLLLQRLNDVLPEVKEPQMYATLAAFRLNADGSAWYAMAASPPVLHWNAQQRCLHLIQMEQYPLGLFPIFGFAGEPIDMHRGDLLVVATDGVLEVCDREQEEFGLQRLEEAIRHTAQQPASELADVILAKVRQFGKQGDDQTLLIIRRTA